MKVFVFKASNTAIGKFDIASLNDLADGLAQFASSTPISHYDYIEASGRTWTILSGEGGLELQEGRERAPEVSPAPAGTPQGRSQESSKTAKRYADAYLSARAINGLGGSIKIVGLVLGLLIFLGGGMTGAESGSLVPMLFGALLSVATGVPIFVLGILVSAQGQTLMATLDSAVHTSPFLTDQQRAVIMSI